MEIYLTKSKEYFVQKVEKLTKNPVGWLISLIELPSEKEVTLTELKKILIQVIPTQIKKKESSSAYLLPNNKLYLTASGERNNVIKKLSNHIYEALCIKEENNSDKIKFYDLSIDLEKFLKENNEEISFKKKKVEQFVEDKKVLTKPMLISEFSSLSPLLAKKRKNNLKPVVQFAEDDPAVAVLISKLVDKELISESYISYNGLQTLEKYFFKAPDILFLDINMPILSGLEVLEVIKELDNKFYIIMLTADNSSMTVQKCLEFGANGYITKPFTKQKLNDSVQQYMKWKKA